MIASNGRVSTGFVLRAGGQHVRRFEWRIDFYFVLRFSAAFSTHSGIGTGIANTAGIHQAI
jgi:hypothetical protein